jgi:hypothetical protein
LVGSLFSIVDMAMMGHYQGPDAPAALAIISPLWNIIYALGLAHRNRGQRPLCRTPGQEISPRWIRTLISLPDLILTLIICLLEAVLAQRFFGAAFNVFSARIKRRCPYASII